MEGTYSAWKLRGDSRRAGAVARPPGEELVPIGREHGLAVGAEDGQTVSHSGFQRRGQFLARGDVPHPDLFAVLPTIRRASAIAAYHKQALGVGAELDVRNPGERFVQSARDPA